MREFVSSLSTKLNGLSKTKYFDDCLILLLAFITFVGWTISTMTNISIMLGLDLLIIIAVLLILFLHDLKYLIPVAIYLIYNIANEVSGANAIPIDLVIAVMIFAGVLIYHTIKNKIDFSKMKSVLGLLGLAVCEIIPLIWAFNITFLNQELNEIRHMDLVWYVLYLGDLGYLVIYCLFANGIKANSKQMFIKTMSYLSILITLECMVCVINQLRDGTIDNIFDAYYWLGWGLCNEAGIMLCFSCPFTFYILAKKKNVLDMLIYVAILGITGIGVLITTSRGAYLIFGLEFIALVVVTFIKAENKKVFRIMVYVAIGLAIVVAVIFHNKVISVSQSLFDKVFGTGIEDGAIDLSKISNRRFELWYMATDYTASDWYKILFGPGFACDIEPQESGVVGNYVYGPQVFHSFIYETMAIGGVFGLACLSLHMSQKYYRISMFDKNTFIYFLVAYISLDLYGLMDNTYHMYYFMIPLVIGIAVLDREADYLMIPYGRISTERW